jgi:hypothetical protein
MKTPQKTRNRTLASTLNLPPRANQLIPSARSCALQSSGGLKNVIVLILPLPALTLPKFSTYGLTFSGPGRPGGSEKRRCSGCHSRRLSGPKRFPSRYIPLVRSLARSCPKKSLAHRKPFR